MIGIFLESVFWGPERRNSVDANISLNHKCITIATWKNYQILKTEKNKGKTRTTEK